MSDEPEPDPVLVALAKRYTQLAVQALEIKTEADRIKARFRLLGRGRHDLGVANVSIQGQKRFSTSKAEEVLTALGEEALHKCQATVIDSDLVKKHYGTDVYEACQVPSGEDKVTIS